jgi:hypothetical protein
MALISPAVGFFAAAILPLMAATLLTLDSVNLGRLVKVLNETAIFDGVLGALVATILWLLGLGYVARPSIYFPAGLSQSARDHLALDIYWYSLIDNIAVKIFASLYPWWFLGVILVNSQSGVSQNTNSSPSQTSSSILIGVVGVAVVALITNAPTEVVAHQIMRRMPHMKVCEELCLLLNSVKENNSHEESSPGSIVDPLGNRRLALAQIAEHLTDAARQFDARRARDSPPHPISTILRAVDRAVRKFLCNKISLDGTLPDDLINTLDMTLAMLATLRADGDKEIYHRLAQQVSAFDKNGEPAVGITERSPGRVAHFANRAMTGVSKVSLIFKSIAAIVVIIAALLLYLNHRENFIAFLHFWQ